MAIPVINDTTFGGNIGQALGTGLQQLAQMKLHDIQGKLHKTQNVQGLQSLLPGKEQSFYQNLAGIDPALQQLFLKEELKKPGEQAYANALNQILGIPSAQQEQPSQQIGQINSKQATDLAKLQQGQEKLRLQKQQILQPWAKSIEEAGSPARKIRYAASNALKILNTGKAFTGISGAITPTLLQSEEGQELVTLLNDIVLQKAQLGKGVPSRLRLQLEQLSKADIWQKPKVIKNILTRTLNDPEVLKDSAKAQALEEIGAEFEDNLPENAKSLVAKRAKEIEKELRAPASKFTKESLPDPSKYKEGQVAKNPETGEIEYIIENGKWEKYNG